MLRIVASVLSIFSFVSFAANGQNIINLASNITRPGSPAPANCQQQAAVLAENIVNFPHPSKWHWVILCDDAGWRQFLIQQNLLAPRNGDQETVYGSTDLAAHLTCLRGSTLLDPDDTVAAADHVIAHELAHIVLNTRDEDRAEQQAITWLREREQRSAPEALHRLTGTGIFAEAVVTLKHAE
ncbi:MAG TPA: hypothetical protein VGD64_09235 [Acidisarcina sp.]